MNEYQYIPTPRENVAAFGIPSFRKRNQRQRRRDHRRIYCHGRKGGRK